METDFILKLWLTNVPVFSSIFIKLMIIYALVESLNAGIPALIQASGKIKWFQIVNSTILLASLPVGYFLFSNNFSPSTILVVFIISRVFTTITTIFLIKRIIKLAVKELIMKVYLKVFMVALLIMPCFLLDSQFKSGVGHFIIFSSGSIILYFIVVFSVGLEKFEKERLMLLLKKIHI